MSIISLQRSSGKTFKLGERIKQPTISEEIIKVYLQSVKKDLKHFSRIVNKDEKLKNELLNKLINLEKTVEISTLSYELAKSIVNEGSKNGCSFKDDDVLEQIPKSSQDSAKEFFAAFLDLGEQSCEAFAEFIARREHWKKLLDASKSKDRWLKSFMQIGEKKGYKITEEDSQLLSQAIDTAVKTIGFTWPGYWQRGRIWSSN